MYLKASLTLLLYINPAFTGSLITYECQGHDTDSLCQILNVTDDKLHIPNLRVRNGTAVTVLKFTGSRFRYLSMNRPWETSNGVRLCNKFPNLIRFEGSNVGLKAINNFDNCTNLKYLDASFNEVTAITDAFWDLVHLEYLNLQNNNIMHIEAYENFHRNKRLKWFSLRGNIVDDFDVLELLIDCPMLEFVDLEWNSLSCASTVSRNSTLKGKLDEILRTKKVVIKDAVGCLPTQEDTEWWCQPGTAECPFDCQQTGNDTLCYIYNKTILDRALISIRAKNPATISVIKFFDSHLNTINNPEGFYPMCAKFTNLTRFEAVNVKLGAIDYQHPFLACSRLKFIDLSFNHIPTMTDTMLRGAVELEYLDLQHNEIESVGNAGYCFREAPKLKWLNLRENKITRLDFVWLVENYPQLEVVDVENNGLKCNETVSGSAVIQDQLVSVFSQRKAGMVPLVKDEVGCVPDDQEIS